MDEVLIRCKAKSDMVSLFTLKLQEIVNEADELYKSGIIDLNELRGVVNTSSALTDLLTEVQREIKHDLGAGD